jgi:hypothetical protein
MTKIAKRKETENDRPASSGLVRIFGRLPNGSGEFMPATSGDPPRRRTKPPEKEEIESSGTSFLRAVVGVFRYA